MNNRKKKKKGAAVQELLGVKTFSDYGIVTNRGELLYYLVTPTNISVLSQTSVETVVLLSRKKAKDYLEVNIEMDDDFLTKAESKGTYDQIKQYSSLDSLVKRMQDDDNGIVPFKQVESERLALAFILDYFDDIEQQLQAQPLPSRHMTDERKTELLRNFVGWFIDHQTSDEGLYCDLHVEIGMTKNELNDYGIQIDEQFEQAEEEHRKEVDETTDRITAEDIVEQAVYAANAPDCCADEHAENMLSMLGANIVDEEIYHDEDECPKLEMGGMK